MSLPQNAKMLVLVLAATSTAGCLVDVDVAQEGFACNPDGTCESGLVCLDDVCVEDPCAEVECRDGELCAYGRCYPQSCDNAACPEGLICLEGHCVAPECANADCGPGEACAGGACYPTHCDGIDCGAGVCVDGGCVPRACVGISCPEGEGCGLGECHPVDCDVPCAPGEVCYEGECVEAACAGISCLPGEQCGRGLCLPSSCDAGPPCGPDEICEDDLCRPASCAGVECPDGAACAAGECRPANCSTLECGPRQVCDVDRDDCVPDICYGRSCPPGERCARGSGCVEANCGDMVCDEGYVCDESGARCIEVSCYGMDCPGDRECVRGYCYRTTCTLEDCGPDEVCVDGVCVEKECVGVICQEGKFCNAGECVEVGEAFEMHPLSGDGQTATVTEELENEMIVRVVDDRGNPVSGHSVSFVFSDLPSGATGHSLDVTSTSTNEDGRASTVLTLGTVAGRYEVRASASGGLVGSPVYFSATALGGGPAELEAISGDGLAAVVTGPLPEPIKMSALDAHGNPSAEADVSFVARDPDEERVDHLLEVTETTTDEEGLAETHLTLGTLAGDYEVEAIVSSDDSELSITFVVTALAGAAHSIEVMEGNHQSAAVTEALDLPLVVRVLDEHGNPRSGQLVQFSWLEQPPSSSGAHIGETSAITEEDGTASTTVELGTRTGIYVIGAFASSLEGSPVTFEATATPGDPSLIAVELLDIGPSVRPGVPMDLALAIEDEHENTATGWTGIIDVYSETDPWAELPGSVELTVDDKGVLTLPESVAFSVSDPAHEVVAVAGALEGTSNAVFVPPTQLESLLVEMTPASSGEVGTLWVALELSSPFPPDGTIELDFSSGYDVGDAELADVSGADGELTFVPLSSTLARIERDGGEPVDAGTEIIVRLRDFEYVNQFPWSDEVTVLAKVEDGRLIAESETTPGSVGRSWSQVSAGGEHTCAIDMDGSLWCWGRGDLGQLGNSSGTDSWVPREVYGGHHDWSWVSAGYHHTCGMRSPGGVEEPGKIYCWGSNESGQLGLDMVGAQMVPALVGDEDDLWLRISSGHDHTCAIKNVDNDDGGTLWCWGAGASPGNGPDPHVLREVGDEHEDWVRVSAGGEHTCGIRASGSQDERSLWCFGRGHAGQLGNGSLSDRDTPTQVSGDEDDWLQVSAGSEHTCGMRDEGAATGSLWCWGLGGSGQLGNDSFGSHSAPVSVYGELEDWTSVSAGLAHTCGVRGSMPGESYCWGDNDMGQLGISSFSSRTRPWMVEPGHDDWLDVKAGSEHTCGRRQSGRFGRNLWCWGSNFSGQLGNDEIGEDPQTEPVPVN